MKKQMTMMSKFKQLTKKPAINPALAQPAKMQMQSQALSGKQKWPRSSIKLMNADGSGSDQDGSSSGGSSRSSGDRLETDTYGW